MLKFIGHKWKKTNKGWKRKRLAYVIPDDSAAYNPKLGGIEFWKLHFYNLAAEWGDGSVDVRKPGRLPL